MGAERPPVRARSLILAAFVGLILSLGAASAAHAAPAAWAPAVDVSPGQPGREAVSAVAPDGAIIAAWTSDSSPDAAILFATSHDDGASWSAPVNLSGTGAYDASPRIAVLDDGTITVVFAHNFTTVQATTSLDDGASWSSPRTLSSPGVEAVYSTVVTDGDTFIASWSQYTGGILYALDVSSSSDGLTWGPITSVSDPGDRALGGRVIVSGLTLTAIWSSGNGAPIDVRTSNSIDGGLTWTPSSVLYTASVNGYVEAFVRAPNGTVTALVIVNDGVTQQLLAARSADGGLTWSLTPLSPNSSASTLTAASDSALVAAWVPIGTNVVNFARSTDNGETWSPAVTATPPGQDASAPQLVVSPTGEITLAFSGSTGVSLAVFATSSTDNGLTWSVPALLSSTASAENPLILLADNNQPVVMWNGTRVQSAARVLAAAAALPATGADPLPWLLAGLLLVAVGAGARLRRSDRV